MPPDRRRRLRMKTKDKAWSDFVRWCRGHGLRPLPAHPWTLAAYARWCEPRLKYPEIARQMTAIARAHLMACVPSPDRHPIVARTLQVMEQGHRAPVRGAALFKAEPLKARRAASHPAKDTAPIAKRAKKRPPRLLRSTPRLTARRPRTS